MMEESEFGGSGLGVEKIGSCTNCKDTSTVLYC
jgi:hypothetical protein